MCDIPAFLPPIVSVDGEREEVLSRLYGVFENDFIRTVVFHRNIVVSHNKKIESDGEGKAEGFWHVITKDDKANGRLIDHRRAERLPWAKPLMEQGINPEIKVWEYNEGTKDKGKRTYIWLKNYDYVVILQNRTGNYYWITAFYVAEWKKRELYKKYDKRS